MKYTLTMLVALFFIQAQAQLHFTERPAADQHYGEWAEQFLNSSLKNNKRYIHSALDRVSFNGLDSNHVQEVPVYENDRLVAVTTYDKSGGAERLIEYDTITYKQDGVFTWLSSQLNDESALEPWSLVEVYQDALGRDTAIIYSFTNTEGEFEPFSRLSWKYNAWGLEEYSFMNYDAVSETYTPFSKYEYDYKDGRIDRVYENLWDNINLNYYWNRISELYYDEDGRFEEQIDKELSFEIFDYVNETRLRAEYPDNTQEIRYRDDWAEDTESWIPSRRFTVLFNADGALQEDIVEVWDASENTYINDFKVVFDYDQNIASTDLLIFSDFLPVPARTAPYALTHTTNYLYANDGWVQTAYRIFSYDDTAITANESVHASSFVVYPIPAHDFITVTGNIDGSIMKIYDQSGTLWQNREAQRGSFDISMLPSGMYIMELQTRQSVVTRRFVKQ